MAIIGYNESSLMQSEIYKDISDKTGIDQTGKAKELINSSKQVTGSDIESQYILLRRMTDSLTRESLKAYDDGSIRILYNDNPIMSMNQAIPFLTFRGKNGYVTYIFADKYITISRDGIMSIRNDIFRDLLFGALISNSLKNNYTTLLSNSFMQDTLTELYCKMVIRVLNRHYSILSDKNLSESIQFYTGKFFLKVLIGVTADDDLINTTLTKNIKYLDDMKLIQLNDEYAKSNPSNITELLELLKTLTPRMKTLMKGVFISSWIDYFYPPSMLAIDNIEYLIFMINAMLNANSIISMAASDIVRDHKNIDKFRMELLKLL